MNGPASFAPTPARSSYFTRHRLGVSLLFLMNGFMMGSWAPKIPEFSTRLSLSESALGLVILVFGVGSLLFMPIAGSQIARFGSRTVSLVSAVLFFRRCCSSPGPTRSGPVSLPFSCSAV